MRALNSSHGPASNSHMTFNKAKKPDRRTSMKFTWQQDVVKLSQKPSTYPSTAQDSSQTQITAELSVSGILNITESGLFSILFSHCHVQNMLRIFHFIILSYCKFPFFLI